MPSQALMSVTFRVSCILEVVAFRKATFASSAFLDCFPLPLSRVGCRNALIGRAEKILEYGRLHRSLIDGVSKNKNTCKLTFK